MNSKKRPNWVIVEERGGSLTWPFMPAVFTLYRIVTSKKFSQATGISYNASFLLNFRKSKNKDYFRNYVKKEKWNEFCKKTFEKLRKNPDFQEKLIKEFKKRVPKFLAFCRKIYNSDLSKKSKQELWQYYEKYIQLYEDIYVWGEPFAFGARFQLADYLSDYLKKEKQINKFDEYFNVLIKPKEKPFITEEREKLLKIGVKIQESPKLREFFKEDLKIIEKEIKKYTKLNDKIEEHKKNFEWVPYDYGSYILTKRHFLKELKELIKENSIDDKLDKIKKQYRNLEKRQKKIFEELEIDKYYQKLFEALRWNSFIIDYKKRIFTISHFLINFSLMKEIAKRLGIEQRYAHCILRDEMKDVLVNNKPIPLNILKKRIEKSVVLFDKGKFKLIINKEADRFLNGQGIKDYYPPTTFSRLRRAPERFKVKEFKGKIANSGKVRGIVKIVSGVKDFRKMKKGDILVTSMTSPEFVSILKKAAAIVTNEGGITCHAAIVSRELGIPCIIGTKIATKVLKDGDLVEVDTEKGIVRVLKR